MTGCARFFLIMLILVPIAYVVASFITGDDGLKFVNDLFGKKEKQEETEFTITFDEEDLKPSQSSDVLDLRKALKKKDRTIDSLERENMRLKARIHDLQSGN